MAKTPKPLPAADLQDADTAGNIITEELVLCRWTAAGVAAGVFSEHGRATAEGDEFMTAHSETLIAGGFAEAVE